ncbi:MAG: ABC transporter substrate-binding protein [Chloroflexi bacterium]|nr:ABC transporter substrate-binding protein [Chloroflexota bacterium]
MAAVSPAASPPSSPAASPPSSPAASPPSSPAANPAAKPSAQGAPSVPAKLTDNRLVIAVINDQSSVYADLSGSNGVKAAQMAVDDFLGKYGQNALGGPIEVISADHQNAPDLAYAKAQELADRHGADLFIDAPTSSAALAIANVAREKRRVYLNVSAATTELTGPQCNKYTFHYAYDTYMLANGTGAEATRSVGKKWYILYPNYVVGQDMARSFQASIKAAGGEVLASDVTPFPNDDFSTFLVKAPTLHPDVLGVMQTGGDLANVVKQYNERKLRDQGITLAVGLLLDTDIHALGPDALAGTVYTTPWLWTLDARSRAWADRFQQVTSARPTFAHAGDYSATMQYLEAVRRSGTDDSDAIVKALEGLAIDDFFLHNGTIRAEDHRVIHDVYLAQVKPSSEVKEPWDTSRVLSTIPADRAFRTVQQSIEAGCKMPS